MRNIYILFYKKHTQYTLFGGITLNFVNDILCIDSKPIVNFRYTLHNFVNDEKGGKLN